MTLLLKQIFQFIKLLNSDQGTTSIAAGIALGVILGMAPVFSLQTILVILVVLLFRVQAGAAFVFSFFVKFVAFFFDPVFHWVGQGILESQALTPLWTSLYHMPIVPFTRFNNSVVMGSGVVSILLAPLVFLWARVAVEKYRVTVVARFQGTKFWKMVKATSFYKWYANWESLYG